METQATGSGCLIFAAACCVALGVLHFGPRRQFNLGGCGPRALHAVAIRMGGRQTEAETLAQFPNNGFEVTLGQLEQVAPTLGLQAHARQMNIADLCRDRPLGVLHVDDAHFIAVVGYDVETVLVVDPLYRGDARPARWYYDDLKVRWDGAILVVTKHRRQRC